MRTDTFSILLFGHAGVTYVANVLNPLEPRASLHLLALRALPVVWASLLSPCRGFLLYLSAVGAPLHGGGKSMNKTQK